jgi:uncharacterized caspase-like protein
MKRALVLAALVISLVAAADAGEQPRKVALVIGNEDYSQGRLVNPVNDASDMALALRGLGFAVTLRTDADRKAMRSAIDAFGAELAGTDIALFFYSGHGVQISGENYLIPVSSDVKMAEDVPDEAIPLTRLLSRMSEHKSGTNIVILDACRNNPFPAASRGLDRGLAVIGIKPPESIIVYSTEAGSTANDGSGRNGVFTEALLNHLAENKPFSDILMAVNADVQQKTDYGQKPAQYQNLTRPVFLSGGETAAGGPKEQRAAMEEPGTAEPRESEQAKGKVDRAPDRSKGLNDLSLCYVESSSSNPMSGLLLDIKVPLCNWLFFHGRFGPAAADSTKIVCYGGVGANLTLWGFLRPSVSFFAIVTDSASAGFDWSLSATVMKHAYLTVGRMDAGAYAGVGYAL